jgi:phage virion morphogenesis protein
MAGDDIGAIEPWLQAIIGQMAPSARAKLARKIGIKLRMINAARIAANIEPDGSAMQARIPRKPRITGKTARIKSRGRMFQKLRLSRNMKMKGTAAGADIYFGGRTARLAAINHFGDEMYVGEHPKGGSIRIRVAARELLGFGGDDAEAIAEMALAHLTI